MPSHSNSSSISNYVEDLGGKPAECKAKTPGCWVEVIPCSWMSNLLTSVNAGGLVFSFR